LIGYGACEPPLRQAPTKRERVNIMPMKPLKLPLRFPQKSKMPLIAGILMIIWVVLGYFPVYFSPIHGYIAHGGIWILFALFLIIPIALFLIFTFLLAKKKPWFLLLPWGLYTLFIGPYSLAVFFIMQYYSHYTNLALHWKPPVILNLLLSAAAMICYCLTVSGHLKNKIVPLVFAIAAPVCSVCFRLNLTPLIYDVSNAVFWVNALSALPFIFLAAGLKPAPYEPAEKGE